MTHTAPPHLALRLARRGLYTFRERIRPVLNYLVAEMDHVPGGWRTKGPLVDGWDSEAIVEAQAKHWPTLVRNLQGTGPLGVAHFPWSVSREDRSDHNVMMSYGYVLARAVGRKDRISILDWGGGAGHYYLYSVTLLPEVAVDYHCFDLPGLCKLGRTLLPEATFHHDERELRDKTFDLVVSSSSLHYFENWHETARRLASATGDFLYVARLQTVLSAPSFVALHRPHRAGYTEFLSWCLNRQELVRCMEESDMILRREFVHGGPWTVRGGPEKMEARGFLFQRQSA